MNVLTVRQVGAVAEWLIRYEAAAQKGGAHTLACISDLAQVIDTEFGGHQLSGGLTAQAMSPPVFIRSAIQLVHDIIDANKSMGAEFAEASAEFAEMLDSLKVKAVAPPA